MLYLRKTLPIKYQPKWNIRSIGDICSQQLLAITVHDIPPYLTAKITFILFTEKSLLLLCVEPTLPLHCLVTGM